jgi:hypothetical protein
VAVLLLGAACTPFVVLTLYLVLSRWPSEWWTAWTDFTAIGFAIGSGVWFITRLGLSAPVPACIGYAAFGAILLFVYAFIFVCVVFGECL